MKPSKLALLILALVFGASWLWWLCQRDNQIAFLPQRTSTDWIIYPKPPDTSPHSAAPISAVFFRSFNLEQLPPAAQLSLRVFKQGLLSINGRPVPQLVLDGTDWKAVRTADVTAWLRAGQNVVSVTVSNYFGPPALELALKSNHLLLATDTNWQASLMGSAVCHAVLAATPPSIRPGNYLYGRELLTASLRKTWPYLILILALSLTIVGIIEWLTRSPHRHLPLWLQDPSHYPLLLFVLICGAWAILFWNNLPQIAPLLGFDRDGHLQYIDYILQKQSLPLADEGWQMYQPPLYYACSAILIGLFGGSASADSSVLFLRWLSAFISLVQLWLIWSCLRLLFPKQSGPQCVGLVVAGFLPAHLYLSHHVTNETLAAIFVTAALYFCLRILRSSASSSWLFAIVGVFLGLAMLTKFSALLAIPFILAVLFWQEPSPVLRHRLARLWPPALTVLAMLAVCGWHYLRVWIHFGTPLLGNWDPRLPFAWWQEPGFHTARWFGRFGQSFLCPLFSSLNGFVDGFYSSLWGDALGSGSARVGFRPQWNYDLMNDSYLLALMVTALFIAGFVALLLKWLRRSSSETFLWLGLVGAFGFGIVLMALRVPSYAQVKAFYALPALLPLTVLAIRGWDTLAGQSRLAQCALWIGLLAWAISVYGALWIRAGEPFTYTVRGVGLLDEGRFSEAAGEFSHALQLDPHSLAGQTGLAEAFSRLEQKSEARQQAAQALAEHHGQADAEIRLGVVLGLEQQYDAAVGHLRRGLEFAPDHPLAWHQLATCLDQLGRPREVIEACRQGLRVDPFQASLHYLLATTATQNSDPTNAVFHYRLALVLQPDRPDALNNLAWILAANADPHLRNGAEAVQLAERACALTRSVQPLLLGTLAAAYAEAGRFEAAVNTAEKASTLAAASGQEMIAATNRKLSNLYRNHQPYHEPP